MSDSTAIDANERRKRATQEAAAWWVQLRAEELSRAEREQLVDWLRESALHVAEMLRLSAVHSALRGFHGWAEVNMDGPDSHDPDDDEANVVTLVPSGSPVAKG